MHVSPTEKISTDTLVSNIVLQLMKRLESGELKPGDKLPSIIELAAFFGVSRNSLREALSVLSVMGYISAKAGDGTFVTEPDFWCIKSPFVVMNAQGAFSEKEFIQARKMLEAEALRALTQEQISALSSASVSSFWSRAFSLVGNRVLEVFYRICTTVSSVEDSAITEAVIRSLPDKEHAVLLLSGRTDC